MSIKKINKNIVFLIVIAIFLFGNAYSKESKKKITAFIAVDNLNWREKPSTKSEVKLQLIIGEEIDILYVSNKKTTIGNKVGKWVKIKTGRLMSEPEGWVFDYYIAYKDRFQKVNNWPYKKMSACAGDYCPSYVFNKDGSFKVKFWQYHDEFTKDEKIKKLCEKKNGKYTADHYCHFKGHLYKYLNLVLARLEGTQEKHYIVIKKNNKLSIPFGESSKSE